MLKIGCGLGAVPGQRPMGPSASAPVRGTEVGEQHDSAASALADLKLQKRPAPIAAQPTAHSTAVFGFDQQHPAAAGLDPADQGFHPLKRRLALAIVALHGSGAGVHRPPVALAPHVAVTAHLQLQTLQAGRHSPVHVRLRLGLPGARERAEVGRRNARERAWSRNRRTPGQRRGQDHQKQAWTQRLGQPGASKMNRLTSAHGLF